MKLARHFTGRPYIVGFLGGFHGRTYGSVTLTASKAKYHARFNPLLPGVYHAPFGKVGDLKWFDDVLFNNLVPADEVAAVVIEPIQGEGGYIVPEDGFLEGLRELCTKHGILLSPTRSSRARAGPERCGRSSTGTSSRTSSSSPRASPRACRSGRWSRQAEIMESWASAPTARRTAATRWRVPQRWPRSSSWRAGSSRTPRRGASRRWPGSARSTRAAETVLDVRGKGLMIGVEFADPARRGRPVGLLPARSARARVRQADGSAVPAARRLRSGRGDGGPDLRRGGRGVRRAPGRDRARGRRSRRDARGRGRRLVRPTPRRRSRRQAQPSSASAAFASRRPVTRSPRQARPRTAPDAHSCVAASAIRTRISVPISGAPMRLMSALLPARPTMNTASPMFIAKKPRCPSHGDPRGPASGHEPDQAEHEVRDDADERGMVTRRGRRRPGKPPVVRVGHGQEQHVDVQEQGHGDDHEERRGRHLARRPRWRPNPRPRPAGRGWRTAPPR